MFCRGLIIALIACVICEDDDKSFNMDDNLVVKAENKSNSIKEFNLVMV